jgi:hypothetical protein
MPTPVSPTPALSPVSPSFPTTDDLVQASTAKTDKEWNSGPDRPRSARVRPGHEVEAAILPRARPFPLPGRTGGMDRRPGAVVAPGGAVFDFGGAPVRSRARSGADGRRRAGRPRRLSAWATGACGDRPRAFLNGGGVRRLPLSPGDRASAANCPAASTQPREGRPAASSSWRAGPTAPGSVTTAAPTVAPGKRCAAHAFRAARRASGFSASRSVQPHPSRPGVRPPAKRERAGPPSGPASGRLLPGREAAGGSSFQARRRPPGFRRRSRRGSPGAWRAPGFPRRRAVIHPVPRDDGAAGRSPSERGRRHPSPSSDAAPGGSPAGPASFQPRGSLCLSRRGRSPRMPGPQALRSLLSLSQ